MTTAEFIIGHSADDAAERKKEARKILWALLAALGIHLLIGYSLAVFGGLLYSPFSVIEEDKPVELTFVDLATPAPVKNAMFIPNDESKQTEQPKEKTFESNANSIAASEVAPTGSMPLPSQQGVDRNTLDLDSHRESLPNEGAQPQPSVAQQSATPQPSAQPTPISKSEEFAMLTSTPTPRPSAASTPQQPKSSYQPFKQKTRLAGYESWHLRSQCNWDTAWPVSKNAFRCDWFALVRLRRSKDRSDQPRDGTHQLCD